MAALHLAILEKCCSEFLDNKALLWDSAWLMSAIAESFAFLGECAH